MCNLEIKYIVLGSILDCFVLISQKYEKESYELFKDIDNHHPISSQQSTNSSIHNDVSTILKKFF